MHRSSRFLSLVLMGTMTVSLSLPLTTQAQEYSYFGQWMQTVVLQSITASMNESVSAQDDTIAVQSDPTQAEPVAQSDEPQATATPAPEEVAEAPKKDEILSTTLKPGDNSHEVTLLQLRLMELQCFDSDEATGLYGTVTTEAVKLFQRSNDLEIDGVAGKETIELMFSDEAKKYVAKQGDSGSDVASIQRRLAELNYFNDKATGYYLSLIHISISLAHRLSKQLAKVRKEGTLAYLRPDGKTQVTVEYEDGKPVRVDTIVISTQHNETVSLEQLRTDLIQHVIKAIIPAEWMDEHTVIHINPTGRFVIGGPQGDSGLTGRKIIVDTYGGYSRHGGGCFSGKDPTKDVYKRQQYRHSRHCPARRSPSLSPCRPPTSRASAAAS